MNVNIIPRSNEEYARGKALYSRWAQNVVKMGGSVSAEHGIGKLKMSMTKWALTLNVSRPSLHRELRKLEAMGFVRYRPPDIEILDAEGLRSTLMQ